MSRPTRVSISGTKAATLGAVVAFFLAASAAADPATAPLSGVVRAGGHAVAGATLLVRCVSSAAGAAARLLKTESDGTFVWSDARPGLYTIVTVVPGFRPAVARILHRANRELVSFVPLDLESSGILPPSRLGGADPWIARALVPGDALRDLDPSLAAPEDVPPPVTVAADGASSNPRRASTVPVRASVTSTAGFGADGDSNLSRTSLDVSGVVGGNVRWGVEGQYSRLTSVDGLRAGDASRLALDVAPGAEQTIHLSTRRQILPGDDADGSRFAAHAVDWSGATGDRSRASVSARLVSQSNLVQGGPVADLFARASNALDVQGGYRTDLGGDRYVRLSVGYRSAYGAELVSGPAERETRVGGVAGARILGLLVVEGGATGDFSPHARGVTPEVTLAVETRDGWKVFGFASRRFERRLYGDTPLGLAGTDDADLTRLSRSLYRGGLRYENTDGESFSLEASERELDGTYRLLIDPDFVDRLDSLYFFTGDVAAEISSSATFHVRRGLDGRLSARAGRIHGERDGSIQRDEASYGVAEAALRVRATRTSVGVGYRVVSQTLTHGTADLRNDIESVDFTIAQGLPVPILRALGSEWKALFSVELGRRRQGQEEERSNRRLSGGIAMAF